MTTFLQGYCLFSLAETIISVRSFYAAVGRIFKSIGCRLDQDRIMLAGEAAHVAPVGWCVQQHSGYYQPGSLVGVCLQHRLFWGQTPSHLELRSFSDEA